MTDAAARVSLDARVQRRAAAAEWDRICSH